MVCPAERVSKFRVLNKFLSKSVPDGLLFSPLSFTTPNHGLPIVYTNYYKILGFYQENVGMYLFMADILSASSLVLMAYQFAVY